MADHTQVSIKRKSMVLADIWLELIRDFVILPLVFVHQHVQERARERVWARKWARKWEWKATWE